MHKLLIEQTAALIEDETDLIANLANIASLINMSYDNINWVGFYLYKDSELVLGPFQGKVACTRLKHGVGVCMKGLETNTTQNIADVHSFEGHVVCDAASKSELVVPIYIDSKPFGVLDIDAPIENRFSTDDQKMFEELVAVLIKRIYETK